MEIAFDRFSLLSDALVSDEQPRSRKYHELLFSDILAAHPSCNERTIFWRTFWRYLRDTVKRASWRKNGIKRSETDGRKRSDRSGAVSNVSRLNDESRAINEIQWTNNPKKMFLNTSNAEWFSRDSERRVARPRGSWVAHGVVVAQLRISRF